MSDDEVVRFEITDYDLDNEFNIHRSRRPNKEQQIYGVWAKDSDEEENEDNVRRKTRKPKDYSAPIGFIAGGVQQAGKKKEEKKELQPADPQPTTSQAADSSDEEPPPAPLETDTAGIRRQGQGMRTQNLGGNMGNWEKHTKGIGAKLLLQMGYQPGKGLGKDLQGISAPVEATLRKGRGAIGAYGPEKSAQKAKKEEEKRLKAKEEEEKQEKTYNWKKSHKGRYFYRDAADVIQEGKPSMHNSVTSSLSRVPVIDLTGRERRVLSGYHALAASAPRFEHEPRRRCDKFAAPQLTHNLDLIVQYTEQDIIQNARELQAAEDEIVVLERDIEENEQKLKEQDVIIEKVEAILGRVEELNQPDLSLGKAYEILAELKESFPAEYEQLAIGSIAGHVVSPLLSALLAEWAGLAGAERPAARVGEWRALLTEEAYAGLLCQHWLPRMHVAAESWNPRDPEPMLRCIAAWAAVSPAWVVDSCVTRHIVPRVAAAATLWDPTIDTEPLHRWLLPWHERAGAALATSVYPLVRARLVSALRAWHPADTSALPLLAAWRGAWGGALAALLQQHIVPKLEHCLSQAPVQLVPAACPAWDWCVSWLELVGAPTLASLANRALLPRWLTAMAAWLNTAPPHSAVLQAYTAFKKLFPDEITKEPGVRDSFRKALDMMNRSTDTVGIEPPPPPRLTDTRVEKEPSRIADIIASSTQAKSFSELLETRCIEKGITFVPIAGKTREGRPLYKIGDMQCYVIRNVIMYSEDHGRTFAPIGLDRLMDICM